MSGNQYGVPEETLNSFRALLNNRKDKLKTNFEYQLEKVTSDSIKFVERRLQPPVRLTILPAPGGHVVLRSTKGSDIIDVIGQTTLSFNILAGNGVAPEKSTPESPARIVKVFYPKANDTELWVTVETYVGADELGEDEHLHLELNPKVTPPRQLFRSLWKLCQGEDWGEDL